jgi:glutamyl-tRNA synthetase
MSQVIDTSKPVRVRFAPSPTGDMHIGGGRTALFNWLFARRYGGKFLLRIEDTDEKRFVENALQGIMDGLKWLGLEWDEGPDLGGTFAPYVQSQRLPLYQKWAQWLLDEGKAYRAYETADELEIISATRKAKGLPPGYDRRARNLTPEDWARYDAEGRPYVIRFKMPLEGETTVTDLARGAITVKNESMQDLVLLKSDGYPTYHLANVVDDHFMEITHILRAEEWISTAPVHRQLYLAFGWEQPQIAHLPVILKIDGKGKMSKRDEGASISYFIDNGYLPKAVINYLCNVGWNYGLLDEKGEEIQVFSKEDAAKVFDVTRVATSGTKFDLVKLRWLNGLYVREMETSELANHLRPFLEKAGYTVDMAILHQVIPIIRERIGLLKEIVEIAGFLFAADIEMPPAEEIIQKKTDATQTTQSLKRCREVLNGLAEWSPRLMEEALRPLAEELGLKPGQLFGALRVAVTGRAVSPPLMECMEIIGREKVLARIDRALAVVSKG